MARLTIGDGVSAIAIPGGKAITQLIVDFSSLKTVAYEIEPEMDRSGKDYLCSKVTLEIMGIVSRTTICTGKVRGTPPGPEGTGDDLPWTNALTRDLLMVPRQRTRFEIGGQTVLLTPGQNATTGAFFNSDVRGGPYPQRASYSQFIGEKMALLHYRLVTFVNYGLKSSALLSLRWVSQSAIDEYAYTTRTTRGVAVFRKDYLDAIKVPPVAAGAVPDDFRKWVCPPVLEGMRRTSVDVTQNEDGTELEYVVQDTEETLGLGSKSKVMNVSGTATVGIDTPIKDLKSVIKVVAGVVKAGLAGDVVGVVEKVFNAACPTNRNCATMRATGTKDVDRKTLILAAAYAALDRLIPVYTGEGLFGVGAKGAIVSSYVTVNLDTSHPPYAEVKMEVLGFTKNVLTALLKADAASLLNISTTVVGPREGIAGMGWGPGVASAPFPNSGGARGTSLRRMLAQALAAPTNVYDLPVAPPPDISAVDTRGLA